MKLVRRARKSLVERRLKVCLNELTSNLSKVELRVHRHLKQRREETRAAHGGKVIVVPKEILEGRMNDALYAIECRLHREAGIPPPRPYRSGLRPSGQIGNSRMMVGLVPFSEIVAAVRKVSER